MFGAPVKDVRLMKRKDTGGLWRACGRERVSLVQGTSVVSLQSFSLHRNTFESLIVFHRLSTIPLIQYIQAAHHTSV